jgi:hypothetical protein
VKFPESFVGKYFCADLCSGWIRLFDPATGTASPFASGISNPVDLKVSVDGSLYYLARGSNAVFRVEFLDPMLVTEANSDIAIAFDSPWQVRDPFPLNTLFNFSSDQRTRVILFGMNLDLGAGEDTSSISAQAEDAALNIYPLTVEFVGKVAEAQQFTRVIVRLPNNTPPNQSLLVSVTFRGKTSNKVRIRMK